MSEWMHRLVSLPGQLSVFGVCVSHVNIVFRCSVSAAKDLLHEYRGLPSVHGDGNSWNCLCIECHYVTGFYFACSVGAWIVVSFGIVWSQFPSIGEILEQIYVVCVLPISLCFT